LRAINSQKPKKEREKEEEERIEVIPLFEKEREKKLVFLRFCFEANWVVVLRCIYMCFDYGI
jgi:hypothetical protein